LRWSSLSRLACKNHHIRGAFYGLAVELLEYVQHVLRRPTTDLDTESS